MSNNFIGHGAGWGGGRRRAARDSNCMSSWMRTILRICGFKLYPPLMTVSRMHCLPIRLHTELADSRYRSKAVKQITLGCDWRMIDIENIMLSFVLLRIFSANIHFTAITTQRYRWLINVAVCAREHNTRKKCVNSATLFASR